MKNILVVIDMQNGFVRDIDSVLLDRVRHLTTSNIFDAVIATRFVNEPDSSFVNILGWDKMMSGEELKLIDDLAYNAIVEKCTYSCVTDDFVDVCCRLNDCEMPARVFLCGVDTDSCVLASAIDLFDHGVRPMLLSLYCASSGKGFNYHETGLILFKRMIGAASIISDELKTKADLEQKLAKLRKERL